MTVSQTTRPSEPFLILYQSKSKALLRIIVASGFLLVSVAAAMTPISPNEHGTSLVTHVLSAYAGPPIMAVFLIWSVIQSLSRKPVLVIDEQGITTSVSGIGLIAWSEVAEVTGKDTLGGRWLGIVPRNIEAFAAHVPPSQAKNVRFNQERMGMAVAISEQLLPMKVDQLLVRIGDYCARQIHENA